MDCVYAALASAQSVASAVEQAKVQTLAASMLDPDQVDDSTVQQWGRIDDIEGPVVLFGPHTVDDRTRDLVGSHRVRPQTYWPAADLEGSPVVAAPDLLLRLRRRAP